MKKTRIALLIAKLILTGCAVPLENGPTNPGGESTATLRGVAIDANEFPFVGAVRVISADGLSFEKLCAGTLISSTEVVTAASCIPAGVSFSRVKFTLAADLNDMMVGDSRLKAVTQVLSHPTQQALVMGENDIAVLKLGSEIILSSYAIFEPLTSVLTPGDFYTSASKLTVVGYGSEASADKSKRKGIAQLRAWIEAINANSYLTYGTPTPVFQLTEIKGNEQDVCLGDVGGPALYLSGNNVFIIGVSNGGRHADGKCESTAFFADTSSHATFVHAKQLEARGCTKDYDQDGDIDGADLEAWKALFNMGLATGTSFLEWQRSFGINYNTPIEVTDVACAPRQ